MLSLPSSLRGGLPLSARIAVSLYVRVRVRVCVCACVFACVCNRHANERGAQTNLPEPVRSAAVQMSYFWDRQKEKVAMQCGPLTHFIPKPAMDVWERAKDRFGDIVAQGPCACACIIQTCWIPVPMHLRPTCMHARARARTHTHMHAHRQMACTRTSMATGCFQTFSGRRSPSSCGRRYVCVLFDDDDVCSISARD